MFARADVGTIVPQVLLGSTSSTQFHPVWNPSTRTLTCENRDNRERSSKVPSIFTSVIRVVCKYIRAHVLGGTVDMWNLNSKQGGGE